MLLEHRIDALGHVGDPVSSGVAAAIGACTGLALATDFVLEIGLANAAIANLFSLNPREFRIVNHQGYHIWWNNRLTPDGCTAALRLSSGPTPRMKEIER
jgi:hypothetical protein